MKRNNIPPIEPARNVAHEWSLWCGDNRWTKALARFNELGGFVQWWSGYPQSASAIPLTFTLFAPDGTRLECSYRLKDILAAIATLEAAHSADHCAVMQKPR